MITATNINIVPATTAVMMYVTCSIELGRTAAKDTISIDRNKENGLIYSPVRISTENKESIYA